MSEDKIKKIIKRVNQLEDRIEELEQSRVLRHGTKTEGMAKWIWAQFEKKDEIPVEYIMRKGATLGYSRQMLSKTKRDLLGDQLGTTVGGHGKPWMWVKIK